MPRTLLVRAVAGASLVLALTASTTACQPTGHPRCDRIAFAARTVIESNGWRVDCDPGFSSWSPDQGRYVSAWDDHARKTVWVWPENVRVFVNRGSDDAALLKTLWHEAAHSTGIGNTCKDEEAADAYAYRHMKAAEREGLGFFIC